MALSNKLLIRFNDSSPKILKPHLESSQTISPIFEKVKNGYFIPQNNLPDKNFRKCSCKKSSCLKSYCECFAKKRMCFNCNCEGCKNNYDTIKNKKTFKKKKSKILCKCTKSKCQKKYCDCYKNNKLCELRCRCVDCFNKNNKKNPFQIQQFSISIVNSKIKIDTIN